MLGSCSDHLIFIMGIQAIASTILSCFQLCPFKFEWKYKKNYFRKCIWKYSLHTGGRPYCPDLNMLTQQPLGDVALILKSSFSHLSYRIVAWALALKLIALRWISQNLINDKATLIEAMTWCHQATNHYSNHCWPRSMLPYDVTRLQWVNNRSYQPAYFW